MAECQDTGGIKEQAGRKWRLSKHMTDSEIVQTAFLAVRTAQEHELREQFKYKGYAIFNPHFDLDHLVKNCVVRSARNAEISQEASRN